MFIPVQVVEADFMRVKLGPCKVTDIPAPAAPLVDAPPTADEAMPEADDAMPLADADLPPPPPLSPPPAEQPPLPPPPEGPDPPGSKRAKTEPQPEEPATAGSKRAKTEQQPGQMKCKSDPAATGDRAIKHEKEPAAQPAAKKAKVCPTETPQTSAPVIKQEPWTQMMFRCCQVSSCLNLFIKKPTDFFEETRSVVERKKSVGSKQGDCHLALEHGFCSHFEGATKRQGLNKTPYKMGWIWVELIKQQ